eukprot:10129102-Lingulodinium_polyedra.AAC.1
MYEVLRNDMREAMREVFCKAGKKGKGCRDERSKLLRVRGDLREAWAKKVLGDRLREAFTAWSLSCRLEK